MKGVYRRSLQFAAFKKKKKKRPYTVVLICLLVFLTGCKEGIQVVALQKSLETAWISQDLR